MWNSRLRYLDIVSSSYVDLERIAFTKDHGAKRGSLAKNSPDPLVDVIACRDCNLKRMSILKLRVFSRRLRPGSVPRNLLEDG